MHGFESHPIDHFYGLSVGDGIGVGVGHDFSGSSGDGHGVGEAVGDGVGVGPAADTSVAISLKLVPVAMPAIIRTGSNKILAQFDLIKSSPVKIDLDVCEAFRINSLAEV